MGDLDPTRPGVEAVLARLAEPLAVRALGLALVLLGLVGLIVHDLGLTPLHDLVHLIPGLALLAAGWIEPGRSRSSIVLVVGTAYVLVGAASLVAPSRIDPWLGISALANGVHLVGGLVLVGAAQASSRSRSGA